MADNMTKTGGFPATMAAGSAQSDFTPSEAVDRLRLAMAAGGFEILSQSSEKIEFRHGTYLTESAPLLPKKGVIRIIPSGGGCRVEYEIGVTGFVKYWIAFIGIAFCWLIFPFFIMYQALFHHPRRLMENLLQAI